MAEKKPITVNEVIARNVVRLRKARSWKQKDLAQKLQEQTGEDWPAYTLSRMVSGQRSFSADEMVALARVFRVPLPELFVVDSGVMVNMGRGTVTAEDFYQLTFWIPSGMRHRLTESLYGGFDDSGEARPKTQHSWQYERFRTRVLTLWESGKLTQDLLDKATGSVAELYEDAEAVEEYQQAQEQVRAVLLEDLEPEVYDAITADERFWAQAYRRRYGGSSWGTSESGDYFTDFILEIIRGTAKGDDG